MARYGNTTASNVLSAAKASASTYQALEDKQYAEEFKYSYQTEADLKKYSDYLNNRFDTLKDSYSPSDQLRALAYRDTLIGAQRTFNSNQVQNETIQILNGNATEQDKLGLLQGQLTKAIQSGADPQTVQGLETLYSNQVIKVQNQAVATANAAAAGNAAAKAALYKQSVTAPLKDINTQIAQWQDVYKNGKADANTYARNISALFQQKDKILSDAAATPGLEDYADTIGTAQANLHKEANFDKLADPGSLMLLHNGVDLFKSTEDDHGNHSLDYNNVVGFKNQQVQNPDGTTTQVRVPQIGINTGDKQGKALKTLGVPGSVVIHTANGDIQANVKVDNLDKPTYAYVDYKDQNGIYHKTQITADGQHVAFDPKNEDGLPPVPNAYKNNQMGLGDTIAQSTGNIPIIGHNPTLSAAAHGIGMVGHSLGHDLSSPVNALGSLLGGGTLGAIVNPVGSALTKAAEMAIHPSQIATAFQNAIHASAPAPLKFAPMPAAPTQPYAKSVLYSAPTPYPNAPVPATGANTSPQQNTNTLAAINKAVGFTP